MKQRSKTKPVFNQSAAAPVVEVPFDLQATVDDIHRAHPEIYDRVFFIDCAQKRYLSPLSDDRRSLLRQPDWQNLLTDEAGYCEKNSSAMYSQIKGYNFIFLNFENNLYQIKIQNNQANLNFGKNAGHRSVTRYKHYALFHELAHAIISGAKGLNNFAESIADVYGLLQMARKFPHAAVEYIQTRKLSLLIGALETNENPALHHYTSPALQALSGWLKGVDVTKLTEKEMQDISRKFAHNYARSREALDNLEQRLFAPLRDAVQNQSASEFARRMEDILKTTDDLDTFTEAKRIADALIVGDITLHDKLSEELVFDDETKTRLQKTIKRRDAEFKSAPLARRYL